MEETARGVYRVTESRGRRGGHKEEMERIRWRLLSCEQTGNCVTAEHIEIVRVYEDHGRTQGEYRVLVDRLWPRGLTKTAIDFDEWDKDVAPSTELRRWYGHDPERFAEFARRYRSELTGDAGEAAVSKLRRLAVTQRLVLLTATRDVTHSAAAVLRAVIGNPETHSPQ